MKTVIKIIAFAIVIPSSYNLNAQNKSTLTQYNLKENIVENTSKVIVVPNISYKIEF